MLFFRIWVVLLGLASFILGQATPSFADYSPGLIGQDLIDFEHLSEGADFLPLEWLPYLKSATFKGPNGKPALFLENLEGRFGFLKSVNQGLFLSPYVGVSASWTNHPPERSDALSTDPRGKIRIINGRKSIRTVGTTCSACHTGGYGMGNQFISIQGAPGRADTSGFFVDLALSMIGLLADPNALTDFLSHFPQVKDPKKTAHDESRQFFAELGMQTHGWIGLGPISGVWTLIRAKFKDYARLNRGKAAMHAALLRLVRLTYGFSEKDNLGDLPGRLQFLATLMTGDAANLKVIQPGFGRFDAFDRPANMILGRPQLDVTGSVRIPPLWALKYMAMVHYNSNTNSVIMRNIIEAVAAGAWVDPNTYESTVNLYNLNRIERLLYKFKVPQWNTLFAEQTSLRIDPNSERIKRGQKIYEQKCTVCHVTQAAVGPEHGQKLYEYKMYSQSELGTDSHEANNILGFGNEYGNKITKFTLGVRDRYYQEHPQQISSDRTLRAFRGAEFFRQTCEGATGIQKLYKINYGDIEAGKTYKATHLAGSWALRTFLHNGSVPTYMDLLSSSTPELARFNRIARVRPRFFDLRTDEFDPKNVGLINRRPWVNLSASQFKKITKSSHRGRYVGLLPCSPDDATCLNTDLPGNHNAGHENTPGGQYDFGTDLGDADKHALIDYIKVLEPEPEYAW